MRILSNKEFLVSTILISIALSLTSMQCCKQRIDVILFQDAIMQLTPDPIMNQNDSLNFEFQILLPALKKISTLDKIEYEFFATEQFKRFDKKYLTKTTQVIQKDWPENTSQIHRQKLKIAFEQNFDTMNLVVRPRIFCCGGKSLTTSELSVGWIVKNKANIR